MENFVVDKEWVAKNYHGEANFVVPEGATAIYKNAFHDCESLTSIHIPEGVTKIGRYAFVHCKSLTSIHIPDGVTEIGEEAFKNCDKLTIRCNKKSYAERYAKFHRIPVEN